MKKTMNSLFVGMVLLWPLCTTAQDDFLDSLRLIGRNLYATLPPNSIVDGMLPENPKLQPFLDGNREQFMNSYLFQDALNYFNEQKQNPESLPSFESFQSISAAFYNQNMIPLGVIDYHYYEIKPSTLEQNIIYEDLTHFSLNIVPGHENSWYNQKSFTYLTTFYPVIEENTINYIIPSSLVFTNDPELTYVWVNVGDARNWFQVFFNTPFQVINTLPNRELRIKVSKTGPVLGQEPNIQIPVQNIRSAILNKKAFSDEELLVSTLDMSGVDPCYDNYRNPIKPNSIRIGEAKISILFHNRSLGMRKPAIFIEGFDVDENPYDNRFGDVNFNTLLTGLSFNSQNKSVKKNLKDLPILINKLRERGYDIVFVDYQNGAGDMVANGNALIKIIQYVNKVKTGSEENIVMGASMGGLLARYALSKMEKNGCNHCTKLYVTFDSPHQGAHVPIGLQYMMEFSANYTGDASAKALYKIALGSEGAQQMLQKNIFPGAEVLRQSWNTILIDLGHPLKCRKVAIANGNPKSVKYNFNSGDLLFDWKLTKAGANIASYEIYSGPNCPNYHCDQIVFKGKLPRGASKVGKWSNSFLKMDYLFKEYFIQSGTHTNWDNVPGGSAEWLGEAAQLSSWTLNGGSTPILNKGEFTSFVPNNSSLDLNLTDYSINISKLFGKLEDQKKPQVFHPFDAIHVNVFENENQPHVLVDNRDVPHPELGEQNNIQFLIEQVDFIENKVDYVLPSIKGNTFNLTNLPNNLFIQLIPTIVINNNGKLHLNGNIKTNYGTSIDAENTGGKTMNYQTGNCYANITINNNGTLMLGDNNTSNDGNNKAIVRVTEGAQLEINNGGILHIHNGSKLIIDEGATLIYKQGARIILEGNKSDIEIKGKIEMEDGAVLTFEKGNSSLGGRLILERTNFNAGKPLRNSSSASQVNIFGSNMNDELIILRGGTIELNFLGTLNLSNGIVLVDDGSRMYVSNNHLNIHHIIFKAFNNRPSNAIGLDIKNETSANISLENNSFQNLTTGLILQNDLITPSIKIKNSTFYNCENGIYSNYKDFNLEHCGFYDCKKGFSANNLYNYGFSKMKNCQFEGNDLGTEILPIGEMDIYLEGNSFKGNALGISANNFARMTMQCNQFISNTYAIYSSGLLNLSRLKLLGGNVGYNNTFYNNENSIYLDDGELYLKDGNNNFYSTKTGSPPIYPNYNFIAGSIKQPCHCLDMNLKINAQNNYWYPVPPSGIIANAGTQYYQLSPVFLNGSMSSSLNASCFSLNEAEQYDQNILGGNGKKDKLVSNDEFLKLIPNPASAHITLMFSTNNEDPAIISILDKMGRIVKTMGNIQFTKGNNVRYYDLSELPKGIYIVTVSQNEKTYTKKLILY
jgi:hypothetical protein